MSSQESEKSNTPSLISVFGSVIASMFGVQSSRKREADFSHGKPSHYIVVGLVLTVLFILTVWGVVQLVMKLAGV